MPFPHISVHYKFTFLWKHWILAIILILQWCLVRWHTWRSFDKSININLIVRSNVMNNIIVMVITITYQLSYCIHLCFSTGIRCEENRIYLNYPGRIFKIHVMPLLILSLLPPSSTLQDMYENLRETCVHIVNNQTTEINSHMILVCISWLVTTNQYSWE